MKIDKFHIFESKLGDLKTLLNFCNGTLQDILIELYEILPSIRVNKYLNKYDVKKKVSYESSKNLPYCIPFDKKHSITTFHRPLIVDAEWYDKYTVENSVDCIIYCLIINKKEYNNSNEIERIIPRDDMSSSILELDKLYKNRINNLLDENIKMVNTLVSNGESYMLTYCFYINK